MKDGIFPGSDDDRDTSVYPPDSLINQSCLPMEEKQEIDRFVDEGNPNHLDDSEVTMMVICTR